LLYAILQRAAPLAALIAICFMCSVVRAQVTTERPGAQSAASSPSRGESAHTSATIHWQHVPLRDAVGRLQSLFGQPVFVDRRIDPSMRITLDIEASSAEEVLTSIAAERAWGAAKVGKVLYLGPGGAAEQLHAIAAAKSQEVARLPAEARTSLLQKRSLAWPRLSEPRKLVGSLVEKRGWRLTEAETIPHDLWDAGILPESTLADQLSVLLIGFDLTFTLDADHRSIVLVPLKDSARLHRPTPTPKRSALPPKSKRTAKESRQVYTLRVKEQPVRAVLQEFSKRLHWAIQTDEASIQAAGKSLDTRVSFSVENADQERLLDALLRPAGLDYRLEGDVVRIIARRYSD
jgi:type II secretory pathway component GspD/PulD (secretin)